jgi:homoprotocatechuate degradation regulator HpaR
MVAAMNAVKASRSAVPEDALLPPDTRRALPLALLRAREAVMGRFRPVLAAHDVTEQQWRVVRILGEESPLDASEVASRACVLAPSLTRIIKALEDRALISRVRDSGDGRRVSLSIAPAGIGLICKLTPQTSAIYADLEALYGRERIDRLLDMLCELAALKG